MARDLSNLSMDEKRELLARLMTERAAEARPLSFAQQRLWFLDRMDPGLAYYNIPSAVRMRGRLDQPALERSLAEIVRRHESLRTRFGSELGRPTQHVERYVDIHVRVVDIASLPESEREAEAHRLATAEDADGFDLGGNLFRFSLVRLQPEDHLLIVVIHHIVSDGWSMGVFFRELAALYDAFSQGQPSPLPDLSIQYVDFASWQRDYVSGDVLQRQLKYWQAQLRSPLPLLELPSDRPRPTRQSLKGARCPFPFPSELTERVRSFAKTERTTPFVALMAVYAVLLHRRTGTDDVLIGYPVANRNRLETEPLIGFFANTLVMRTSAAGNPSFRTLLAQVREAALGAQENQDLPFERLVEELRVERNLSRTPVFQTMFVFQNAPMQPVPLRGLTLAQVPVTNDTAKFDVTLVVFDEEPGFRAFFEYATDLFDPGTIEQMCRQFACLLDAGMASPDSGILDLPLMDSLERERVLQICRGEYLPFDSDATIHGLVERQARLRPQSAAIEFEDRRLTYAEFNERANRLAHCLIREGVTPGQAVGISIDRSLERFVGVLGVLKAGGVYVPMDPAYPRDRLSFMLRDAGVRVIVTQDWVRPMLDTTDQRVICIDFDGPDWTRIEKESPDNPAVTVEPDQLAYILFTSGSTGQPKGVMVEHRGAINLMAAQTAAFSVRAEDRILQFSSLSFDASVSEFLLAVGSGATLCLGTPEDLAPGPALVEWLKRKHISNATIPPSLLALMPVKDSAELAELTTLIVAGETCPRELAEKWAPGRTMFNAYGPTETTVCATIGRIDVAAGRPPIGRPMANMTVCVMDAAGRVVPEGIAGELWIGGPGVARGYLHREDLTAEKFVAGPPGGPARMFRTGDLGRYRQDGQVEFLGRIDQQIKIRGYRVEPGEIEHLLSAHPDVRESLVTAAVDVQGTPILIAYVCPKAGGSDTALSADLRSLLRSRVPEFMVPSAFVFLDSLPLSPNGKIDRNALPAPQESSAPDYTPPRSPLEAEVAELMAKSLGARRVGLHESFFDLGGHSLKAAQLQAQINKHFEVNLSLQRLFEAPTVEGIAVAVIEQQAASAEGLDLEALLSEVENENTGS